MKINKEDLLEKIRRSVTRPLLMRELIQIFKIPPDQRSAFRKQIIEHTQTGLLVKIKGERYGLPEKMNLVHGVLQGHADGFGFVIPDQKEETDVYIHAKNLNGAMHQDKVVCRIEFFKKEGKREGRIIRILERKHKQIVGVYEQSGHNYGFVIPEERRISQHIFIPQKEKNKAKNGEVVIAEITSYSAANKNPEGKIIEILGDRFNPDVEIEMIMHKHELPHEFPPEILSEVDHIKEALPEEELKTRFDFGEQNIFTIDGERAKDFDDAVSIKKTKTGFQLGVHIADVSYYVKKGSLLDQEAYKRGTSIYFPDRVIPMLPPKLSDNLCSLRPKEDRLTLSALIDFDLQGNIEKYQMVKSFIRSKERMTYTDVAKILEDTSPELNHRYADILDDLFLMKELCHILRDKRFAEGSLDFDLPESEIILDAQGQAENIIKVERNLAHKMIEEFMLSANRVAAQHLHKTNLPSIYRVHESPDPEKISDFNVLVHNFGLKLKKSDEIQSLSLQKVLFAFKDKPEEMLINNILLRSMKQARYAVENIGHFGLAFDFYTHFTSPIRRYPDLVIHRLLKETMTGRKKISPPEENQEEALSQMAQHTSLTERIADEAEREVVNLKKIQFMQDKTGEIFKGMVSGVTSFGVFVELKDFFVEGLIHISSIVDDYYIYHEKEHTLKGENTGQTFRIGDKLIVKVEKINLNKRQIDLSLVKKEDWKE